MQTIALDKPLNKHYLDSVGGSCSDPKKIQLDGTVNAGVKYHLESADGSCSQPKREAFMPSRNDLTLLAITRVQAQSVIA